MYTSLGELWSDACMWSWFLSSGSARSGHTNIELKPDPLSWQGRQIHQEGTASTAREEDVSSDLGKGGSKVHPERGGGTGAEGTVSLCKGPEPGGAVRGPGYEVELHNLEPTEPFKQLVGGRVCMGGLVKADSSTERQDRKTGGEDPHRSSSRR